jgi:nucleotide-binding universal stress UspA family protein
VVGERAEPGAPGAPPVGLRVVQGSPVATLTESSADSLGLYLGRGPERTVGPVALGCAFAARCPVTLVPRHEPPGPTGPIVVGLDDSQWARAAIEHAFDEGARTGRAVLVVAVFETTRGGAPVGPGDQDEVRRAVEVRSRATVRALAARCAREHRPGVPVEVGVLEGSPAVVLCDVARRVAASVLVVGARGRGRASGHGPAIGSVATRVVLRGTGTVRVVRGRVR